MTEPGGSLPTSGAPAPPAPVGALVPGPGAGERVAGVAVGARAAILLRRAGCARVVVAPGERERLGPRAPFVEAGEVPAEGRVLLVAGEVVFDRAVLER